MPGAHEIGLSKFIQRFMKYIPFKYDRILKVEKYRGKTVYFLWLEKGGKTRAFVLKFSVPDRRVKWTPHLKRLYDLAGVQVLAGLPIKNDTEFLKFTLSYYNGYPMSDDLKVLDKPEQAETWGERFAGLQVRAWLMGVNLGDNPENFVVAKDGLVPIDEGDLRELKPPIEQILLRSFTMLDNRENMKKIRSILSEDEFFKGMLRFGLLFRNELLAKAFFVSFFREIADLLSKRSR